MDNKKFKNKLMKISERINHIGITASFIKWMILGSLVGIIIGSLSALFLFSLEFATNERAHYPWLFYFLPLGGAFVSFIYTKYGKTSSQGNNLIIEQVYKGDREIPLRMAPLVFIGTFITHLFGGSAGREGTAVQMGGSVSEYIGKLLKLNKSDKTLLLLCGISSGFGSIFGTPLAGTIFGMEVISIGYMHYEALIPCFIASFIGNLTATSWGVHHAHYHITNIPEITIITTIKITLISILFGIVSIFFSEGIHKTKSLYSKFIKKSITKSLVGGLLIIALTFALGTREYLGLGLPMISSAFESHVNKLSFLWKIIFTSLTLGAGYQGGEVTPLFVVGSTFGNSLGDLFKLSPSFLAGLGLISVFCGATNTPLSSFIMGIELFGGEAVVYIFMSCVISYLFSGHHGIYSSQRIYRTKSKVLQVPEHSTIAMIHTFKKNKKLNRQEKNS